MKYRKLIDNGETDLSVYQPVYFSSKTAQCIVIKFGVVNLHQRLLGEFILVCIDSLKSVPYKKG